MRKTAILLLALFCTVMILESCGSQLCPAYSTYKDGRRRK